MTPVLGLLSLLRKTDRDFIRTFFSRYRFTLQERRQMIEFARDLEMWGGEDLREVAARLEAALRPDLEAAARKKILFETLRAEILRQRKLPKDYPSSAPKIVSSPQRKLVRRRSAGKIDGDCPVASPRTVCCNLRTLDAVRNCPFGCSYCTLQTFYGSEILLDEELRRKLASIRILPERFYHFGTGQSSDSLVWGNRFGLLDELCGFAAAHPNILLEFKTKSSDVSYFLDHVVPANVACSWSLNPEPVIQNEEHGTASLAERIRAARLVADRGVRVAFHFHPMIEYRGWDRDYPAIAKTLLKQFDPSEVLFVSFGSVTLIKPVVRKIRERGGATKILQMEMVPDPHGKWTYPAPVKLRLFRTMREALRPWEGSVYFYLCMEHASIWDELFGWHYETNDLFEADFGAKVMAKIKTVPIMHARDFT
ncbi:MAG: spore photoproduct lyase family protein [Candidatus Omnitrophota bacterium]|jgi:spore photoproduct lyase